MRQTADPSATPRNLPAGFRLEAHRRLGSTNERALLLAREGVASGLWVTTIEQTAGRGRRGRGWSSPPGNLYASLLLIDPAPRELAATIAFVTAVALHEAIVDLGGPAAADRMSLKWPNDLLARGRKCAGILIEGDDLGDGRHAVVIGTGVNCVSHPDGTPYPVTDLAAEGLQIDAEMLFATFARRMAEELAIWARGSGFGETRSRWLDRAGGLGQPIRANLPGRVLEGTFDTLDAAGRLVLTRDDGGRETVTAGDVFFAAQSNGIGS